MSGEADFEPGLGGVDAGLDAVDVPGRDLHGWGTYAKTEFVMPGRVPGIHSFPSRQNVDGRDKPGHDQG